MNKTITFSAAGISAAIVAAAVMVVVGPGYLEQRKTANTTTCFQPVTWQDAQRYGCEIR